MTGDQPQDEIPLDDRGIQVEAFVEAVRQRLQEIPTEELRGATLIYATATTEGFKVYEHRVGSTLATTTATLKAFLDNVAPLQLKPAYLEPVETILNALITALGTSIREEHHEQPADHV